LCTLKGRLLRACAETGELLTGSGQSGKVCLLSRKPSSLLLLGDPLGLSISGL
jgi:hypothetical protein